MKTSAPGKLMLLGEHAVVYGYPSIVTAINKRLVVTSGSKNEKVKNARFLDAAIALWGQEGTELSASCEFTGSYGFGSSSAVTVAALKALRPDVDNKTLFDAAYKIVLDIQGTGSGFDVAAAVYGGTLYYVKNKTIEPLKVPPMPLIVAYSGVKSSTVDMISMVSKKKNMYPAKVGKIFQGIAKIVEDARPKIVEGDWERVGRLMDFNQEYLRDLGVSTEKLETLISAAKKGGAWGAKLSGAGGGDCMIAVGPPEVKDSIREAGGEVIEVTAGEEGVRVEP